MKNPLRTLGLVVSVLVGLGSSWVWGGDFVIEAGKTYELPGGPGTGVLQGFSPSEGATRTELESMSVARILPPAKPSVLRVTSRAREIKIRAGNEARGRVYRLTVRKVFKKQVAQRVHRRVRWVDKGRSTEAETITIVVEVGELPRIVLEPGEKKEVVLPGQAQLIGLEPRISDYAELSRISGRLFRAVGKKKTPMDVTFRLRYSIQAIEREAVLRVRVRYSG